MLLDNVQLVADGPFPRSRDARDCSLRRPLSGAQRRPEPRRPARAGRRVREGRRRARARWSRTSACAVVRAYMQHVQDNAEEAVRRVLDALDRRRASSTRWTAARGSRVAISDRQARSAQRDDRLHRHERAAADQLQRAVGRVQGGGALRVPHAGRRRDPDERRLPEAAARSSSPKARCSRPRYPAAVVAGNVETSQAVTDALYGALGVLAASQGTMNNFTFGNARYQYYETISGGAGAGPDFDGASVVQTHMTNSRLTDPEVLEWRFPGAARRFAIRRGSGGAGAHRGGDGVDAARAVPRADDGRDARQSPARARRSASRAACRARRPQLGRARRRHARGIRRDVRRSR